MDDFLQGVTGTTLVAGLYVGLVSTLLIVGVSSYLLTTLLINLLGV